MTLHSEITQDREAITAITPTPGRMRRGLLQFLLVAALLLPFAGCMALQVFMVVDGATLLTPLRLLAQSWVFWALCACFVLLFVLDGRSRLKLVWGAATVRTSWLFGPLELFEVERERAALGPLETIERRAPALFVTLGVAPHAWVVAWHRRLRADRPPEVMELARLPTRAEADALRLRLDAWTPSSDARAARMVSAPMRPAELASRGVMWLLWLPMAGVIGFSLVLVGVGMQSLAIERGLQPAELPWDARAEATLERMSWRLSNAPETTRSNNALVTFDRVHTQLQPQVGFVDAEGRSRHEPLALVFPGGFDASRAVHGDPAGRLEALARAGWSAGPLVFEVPTALLPIALDADGVLRLHEVRVDHGAAPFSRAHTVYWGVLNQIDRVSVNLPLTWMAPSVASAPTVVYRSDATQGGAIWVESEVQALAPRLVDFDGLAYGLGAFGFFAGALLFVWMTPRRLRIASTAGWLLVCISAIGWSTGSDHAARWVGFDRGLQARVRTWLADRILPAAPTLHPIDASVTVGRWTPQGSRRHRLLELLGLSQPPAQRAPDFDGARQAIAQRAQAQLAALGTSDRLALLAELQGTRWRYEREDWLIDAAVIPGVCPWLGDAAFVTQLDAHDSALVAAMQCDAPPAQ